LAEWGRSNANFTRTRKELKIRPGFTPTEDIGRFRPPSLPTSKPAFIPGSNRVKPPPKPETPNPFAQEPKDDKEKSKAQIKNEKRRAAAKAKAQKVEVEEKDWDEDVDDEGDGGLREAFERVDLARDVGDDVEDGGAPAGHQSNESIVDESSALNILEPTPGSGITSAAVTISSPTKPNTTIPTDTNPLPQSNNPTKSQPKPHPIQGGRKGPMSLANPPPIPKPTPKASDDSSWRKANSTSAPNNPKPNGNKSNGKGKGNGGLELLPSTKAIPPVQPEPRVRKEVRVRQGGANDLSSLASRVRGLVLENEKGRNSPKKPSGEPAI